MPPTLVAACHVAPHFLSARKSVDKAVSLVSQAAKNSANLVVFPETYISAFPVWSALRPPTENHDLFHRMVQESIYADGEEVQAIRNVARETETVISIGISEKSRSSTACLYNSNLIIDDAGEVAVHHRKLMPTFFEKLIWSPGDGHGLRVADTPCGRIGALICGENTNPLARYSLMAQREQIHISSWPPIWPTRLPAAPGESAEQCRAPANYDNVLANRLRAAAHCFEAKTFGVMCSGFLNKEAIENIVASSRLPVIIQNALESSPQGVTMFLDPTGAPLPSFTLHMQTKAKIACEFLQAEEGVLYAEMDLDRCIEGKQYHDVVGGYQRLDVFQLQVNRSRKDPVVFMEGKETKE
ncbi:uncharacterized protein N7446_005059 [Penicillium canescens]|uniref:CN hydrolase domain-containing protein n=1 Tax=Penicillium canescens TaxID=5083 RepID=A0AAD6I9F8_PENCN|nr:uncharacterized protein N7446_005059 [Penicillium canescens]KAJ6038249.1 hypothetical protein N7460_008020 [Penicillium canescens]KAJ6039631.1 hypothetical protein N7444_008536 [Penicillium canescens]KAJ6068022.1 hypothetical protein N7446_005059 [Penicillium canescens]